MKMWLKFLISLVSLIVIIASTSHLIKERRIHNEELSLIESRINLTKTCDELWGYEYRYYGFKKDCYSFVDQSIKRLSKD